MSNKVTKLTNEGGSPVEIQDFDLDALASATAQTASQVSTTAQYVPLQDVDGNLVKINMSSFQEAVRNVLGSLLLNNDKGTTISALPALAGAGANIDFGSITPANLASVLGGLNREHLGTSVPIENLGLGYFVSNGHVTGIPSEYSIDTILIIRVKWSGYIATTIIDLEGQAGIYTRRRDEDAFKKQ